MAPKLAEGYNRLALDIESHIRYYQPHCWIVPIHDVAIPPFILSDQARTFMSAHVEGGLQSKLEEMGQSMDYPNDQLKPWYIREAIADFFDKRLYESYKEELD